MYRTAEVAELFGVGHSTVYRAIERQRVEARAGLNVLALVAEFEPDLIRASVSSADLMLSAALGQSTDAARRSVGQTRRAMRNKPALNAFAITFGDQMPKAEHN